MDFCDWSHVAQADTGFENPNYTPGTEIHVVAIFDVGPDLVVLQTWLCTMRMEILTLALALVLVSVVYSCITIVQTTGQCYHETDMTF